MNCWVYKFTIFLLTITNSCQLQKYYCKNSKTTATMIMKGHFLKLLLCSRLRVHGEHLVDLLLSCTLAEIPKGLAFHTVQLVELEERLEGALQVAGLHLVHLGEAHPSEHRRAAEPQLVAVRPVAHEGHLGHVRPRAPVRAAGHADHDLLPLQPHAVQHSADAVHEVRHHPLGLGHGQRAERQRRAGHAQTHQGVHLLDHLHTMAAQHVLDIGLILRQDVWEDDIVRGAHDQPLVILINNLAQNSFQAEVPLILNAALLNVEAQEPFAITLFMPAHPVGVLPLRHRVPRLDWVVHVTLHQRAERLVAQRVHQILQPAIHANLTVAMVT
mmetsp:Transcript_42184/g.69501  ORF Transcript_42184/g.69501 Transcript_42184/m.69501 type:complete len:328 (-) Transcript_42184:1155-2138(-)